MMLTMQDLVISLTFFILKFKPDNKGHREYVYKVNNTVIK